MVKPSAGSSLTDESPLMSFGSPPCSFRMCLCKAKYLYTRVATRGGAYIKSCGTWGNFKIHETAQADGPAGDRPATLRDL